MKNYVYESSSQRELIQGVDVAQYIQAAKPYTARAHGRVDVEAAVARRPWQSKARVGAQLDLP